jgi:hypothetical protein
MLVSQDDRTRLRERVFLLFLGTGS